MFIVAIDQKRHYKYDLCNENTCFDSKKQIYLAKLDILY